jgi:hypothetical protein
MELNQFADRYVALWNEPDPAKRRVQIATLWVERSNRRGQIGEIKARDHQGKMIRNSTTSATQLSAMMLPKAAAAAILNQVCFILPF